MYLCVYKYTYRYMHINIFYNIIPYRKKNTYTIYPSLKESSTAGTGLQDWMHALPKGRLHAKGRPAYVHCVEDGSHQTPDHTEPGEDQIPR